VTGNGPRMRSKGIQERGLGRMALEIKERGVERYRVGKSVVLETYPPREHSQGRFRLKAKGALRRTDSSNHKAFSKEAQSPKIAKC